MQLIVNVFLLVAAYRFCYVLESGKGAAIWGAITGLVMTGVTWLFASGQGMRPVHVLVTAAVEMSVLVPSFWLCARREGLLVTVVNLGVGSAAALGLPYFVLAWIAKG